MSGCERRRSDGGARWNDHDAVSLDDGADVVVARIPAWPRAEPSFDGFAKVKVAQLKPMREGSTTKGPKGKGGGRNGKGWETQTSDEQKNLIGLIGEIAAYGGLPRRQRRPRCRRSTSSIAVFRVRP